MSETQESVSPRYDSVTDPRDPRYGDTRSEEAKGLDTGEQQADNLGPVPPSGYVSQAIASQYATPGVASQGEKPKFNAAIVTSWDEQHPEATKLEEAAKAARENAPAAVEPVPEVDAVRPIDQPKKQTPVQSTDEQGRPQNPQPSVGDVPSLTSEEVVEVEKERDEHTEAPVEFEDVLDSAYAKGE